MNSSSSQRLPVSLAAALACLALAGLPARAVGGEEPDLVVAADGSGAFRSIQAAIDSLGQGKNGNQNAKDIPRERVVILIRDGVYREKLRIDRPCVTLRGESRKGTRIEFPQLSVEFQKKPDRLGRAVVNINADDVVLENLTAANTARTDGPQTSMFGRHAFTIYGRGDRTVLLDCDLLSEGADTVSLWQGDRGRYYHARCHFRGGVDFVCPRGWCYVVDCSFYEVRATAALWHDGSKDPDQKLVVRRSTFDGAPGWYLGRHHHDAQFYLLDCTFSATMADRPLARHRYEDAQKDQALVRQNRLGERCYYHNCHRTGGDYAWFKDNLASAPGAPTPAQIDAAWTFGGTWDPETTTRPTITRAEADGQDLTLTFSEPVTVKGRPRVVLRSRLAAEYAGGSGTSRLKFHTSKAVEPNDPWKLEDGTILASIATARPRLADRKAPR